MKDVVGPREIDRALHGQAVPQIALEQAQAIAVVDPREQVLDVVQRTAPAAETDDVPVGVGQEEIGEVRPHHARDSRDERSGWHGYSRNSIFHESTGTSEPSASC